MATRGSCLCGAVAFELTADPTWAHHCHCSRCRKSRGAAFATNLFVPEDGFRFTKGEDLVRTFQPPDAERFTSAFCSVCGSSLPWFNRMHGNVVVPMGVLDDDPGIQGLANIFVASKAPWFEITDDLPQFPERPASRQRSDR